MRFYTTVILLFISSAIFSQVSEFRSADDDFIDDIENYVKTYDNTLAKDLKSQLKSNYSSRFNSGQKQKIVNFANELLKKKIKPKPHVLAYFKSISGLTKSTDFKANELEGWSNLMEKLLKSRNKKRLTDFLTFTDGLFNQDYISSTSSVKWKLAKGTYTFSYKNGAFVTFNNSDFVCVSKNDSSTIYGTNGILNVSTNTFLGEKGTVTWERVELPKNETFAELSKYKINFKSAGFGADSVTLHTTYLTSPIKGRLLEKVVTFTTNEKARYPQFSSYNQSVELKNIVPDVDYKGSFSLIGMNFKGGATGNNKASLYFNKGGEKFIEIKSNNLIINEDKIISKIASATIFIKKGEVIHQSACSFNYKTETKLAVIGVVDNKSVDNPFESTYHNINMHFKTLSWKSGEDKLTFGAIKSLSGSRATFESANYYNPGDYNDFKFGKANIIKSLYNYQISFEEGYQISAVEFASYAKSILSEISGYLIKMSNLGLIDYDSKTKIIVIKPRLESYVQGRKKQGDYDDIFIFSGTKKAENAILDLNTLDIAVSGVKKFDISKKKFVRIYPKGGKINLGKNRTIKFSGVINAGRTEYFGSDIKFNYEKFALQFEKIDSMRIRIYPLDDETSNKQLKLISKLYNLKGEIIIDAEGNKSGRNKEITNYPILSVNNNPRIYYDNKEIYRGLYKRDKLYFELKPFEMDSLLTFTSSGIIFPGTLYSAGIFPPLNREVRLMNDYTLGFFLKNISENIYESPGKYDNELTLSLKGLTGKGEVSFMTSTASSKLITFFPDSLVARVGLYTNKSQTLPSVPEIYSPNCLITLQPKKQIWRAKNLDSAMSVFGDGVSKFDGEIKLTKEKMTGKGNYVSDRIGINSQEFIFGQHTVDADKADFRILALAKNDPSSFESFNMKMSLDYVARKGDFISNTKTSVIEFPINKFRATIDEFEWMMDENTMDFKKSIDTASFQNYDENKNLIPNYISTKDEQLKLGFFSGIAKYSIDSNTITCKKVPYVVIADSRIIPNKGEIKILRDAEIESLTNSTIISNYTTKYHKFSDAEIEIISSEKYIGKGNYQVSSDETINSKVSFSNIEPNNKGVSVAEGVITEDADFYLSPQFRYYGKIKVRGSDLGVDFDGKTKIITKCEELAVDWIEFNSIVDTSKIIIPLGKSFKDKVSGPTLSRNYGIKFYTAFLADKKNEEDESITPADGALSYNKEKGLFEIGPKDKLLNTKLAGNYISFDDENCSFTSIGNLNIANNSGQMKTNVVGEMTYDRLRDTFLTLNATMKIDFPFNMKAIDQIQKELSVTTVEEFVNLDSTNYDLFLNQTLKGKSISKTIDKFYTSGRFDKFPKELMSNITFFDLRFYWDENSQSFMSQGYANIATLGSNQVFRRCKVYMQVEKRKTGDRLGFLIEYKPQGFYYFYYKNGEMQTASTDKLFNEIIKKTPTKDKKSKGKGDDFYYDLTSENRALLFMRKFKSNLEERFDEEEEEEEEEEENEDMNEDIEDEEDEEEEMDEEEEEEEDEEEDD